MSTPRVYRSTDYGAPTLCGSIGFLIPHLKACLVDGYGSLTISSITHTAGTVSVTTAVAHGLKTYSIQLIAGVNEAGYNGEYSVTVTGTYTFTYTTGGISINTGTGTMTTKTPAAGWTQPYTGTNLSAFRQGGGQQRYLRVDDTTTLTSRIIGYETMSDVNTGVGGFPTNSQVVGGLYVQRSSTADAVLREWVLVADNKNLFLWVGWNSVFPYVDSPMIGYFDLLPSKAGDIYATCLAANVSAVIAGFRMSYLVATVNAADATGSFVVRSFTQIGTAMPVNKISDYGKGNAQVNAGASGLIYPHQTDGCLWVSPIWLAEVQPTLAQNCIRGTIPNMWNPLHYRPLNHGDTFIGTGTLAGKVLMAFNIQPAAQVFLDISSSW
jgi:hypothetical protein